MMAQEAVRKRKSFDFLLLIEESFYLCDFFSIIFHALLINFLTEKSIGWNPCQKLLAGKILLPTAIDITQINGHPFLALL